MIGVVVVSASRRESGRVAGMHVALRNAVLLQSLGCARLVVWGVDATGWSVALREDDRVRLRCDVVEGPVEGDILAVSDRVVLDLTTLRAVAERPAVLFRGGEAVALRRREGRAPPLEDGGQGALHDPLSLCMPARTPEERAAATDALLQRLRKPQDGVVSRHLNRHLSLAVTRLLCRTPLRPNQLSVGILSFGVAAAVLAARGDHASLALAGLMFQAQSVFDGCDGELARLTFRGSKAGEWIDTVGDDLTNYSFFAAAAVGIHRAGLGATPLLVGAIGLGAGLLASGIEYRYLLRIGSGDLLKYPLGFGKDAGVSEGELAQAGGVKRLAGALRPMFKRDFFVFAAMLCAFAGATATLWMLVAFTVGALVTLTAVLRSEWSRRGVAPGQEP